VYQEEWLTQLRNSPDDSVEYQKIDQYGTSDRQ
jgi:hypothetical protein